MCESVNCNFQSCLTSHGQHLCLFHFCTSNFILKSSNPEITNHIALKKQSSKIAEEWKIAIVNLLTDMYTIQHEERDSFEKDPFLKFGKVYPFVSMQQLANPTKHIDKVIISDTKDNSSHIDINEFCCIACSCTQFDLIYLDRSDCCRAEIWGGTEYITEIKKCRRCGKTTSN